jgi:hypothetical protein
MTRAGLSPTYMRPMRYEILWTKRKEMRQIVVKVATMMKIVYRFAEIVQAVARQSGKDARIELIATHFY